MSPNAVPGTQGYAEEAYELFQRYESFQFADIHSSILHLIPTSASRTLDIGSGTGRDAAAFAEMGHRVVAVEPTKELRIPAMVLHPSPLITWLDDSLPDLSVVKSQGLTFDLVFLNAVWMHLDEKQRQAAMENVSSLMDAGSVMIMLLRHGPVPNGRRMFEVTPAETRVLARAQGMACALDIEEPPRHILNIQAGVTWTRLAFVKDRTA